MGFVFGSLRTRLLLYSTTTRRDITLIQRAFGSTQAAHKTPITIDVISDPRCPWCAVAHHRLRKAIDEAALAIPVRVRFSPYFLDDTLPIEGIDRRKYYIQRFGDEAMAKVNQQMKEVFRQEGIGHEYVSDGVACSSLPAHRLLAYAEHQFPDDSGAAERVAAELFRRYFSPPSADGPATGENIANIDVLQSVAAAAGIAADASAVSTVRAFLESDTLTDEVVTVAAENKARELSIPHVTINEVLVLDGTPEVAKLVEVLRNPPAMPMTSQSASQPSTFGIESLNRDTQAARRMRWRSSNLLPRMMAIQTWPDDSPFEDDVHFRRLDESDDAVFYDEVRMEHHLDVAARTRLAHHYGHCAHSVLDNDGGTSPSVASLPASKKLESLSILDICSSWTSHYPDGTTDLFESARISGVGMNEMEMAANKWLNGESPNGSFVVQDLNIRPHLSHIGDEDFDLVTCSLSIDYLTKPLEVLQEAHRVLKPGGLAVVAFSDRMFRSKAIDIWRDADDWTRLWVVAAYFHYSCSWKDITVLDLSPDKGGLDKGGLDKGGETIQGDPVFVVQGWKQI